MIETLREETVEVAFKKARKKAAIEFARWINRNGYREYDQENRWIQWPVSKTLFTTEQLYNKFEKEKATL